MINVQENMSFPKWLQVFAFGELIEEVEGKAKALRVGKKLARKNKLDYVYFLGDVVSAN